MGNEQKILDEIYSELKGLIGAGELANYIPVLSQVPADQFGIALKTVSGESFGVGDYQTSFSIQSISKLFVLSLAMMHTDSDRWHRVGREPSGTSFNSLVQLEQENGRPRNPFINAGAIVMTDYLCDFFDCPRNAVLDFIRAQSGNDSININQEVFDSEQATGHRNYALAHFMKSYGNLNHDVETVLKAYFGHCSIEMSCLDLACAVSFLSREGIGNDGKSILDKSKIRRINSLMLTCGAYDNAGEFAFRIGLPTKSGVGGGIVGVLPGSYSVAVWSPGLNSAGNSELGMKALELLTTKFDASIF